MSWEENLVKSRDSVEDIAMNSTEAALLNPVDNIVDKISSSKIGEISSVKRKTKMAKDITGSTRTLFKIRRRRKNNK